MHDWNRVPAGIFHAMHHQWIAAFSQELNAGLLPPEYYALAEQVAGARVPDVLTLKTGTDAVAEQETSNSSALLTRPTTRFVVESDEEAFRRNKYSIVIRHVSDDRLVAMVEIVSPGNKSSRKAFKSFVDKVCALLERRIHLLILDPFPTGKRDPNGVHAAIWDAMVGEAFELPADKPLTLVAYECELATRAYIEPIAVRDPLPDMPLFLEPNGCVMVPLELTYQAAFDAQPRRWRTVLEQPSDTTNGATA
jgi:hypothetical protein